MQEFRWQLGLQEPACSLEEGNAFLFVCVFFDFRVFHLQGMISFLQEIANKITCEVLSLTCA
jgi:hypothetical protein